MPTNRVAGPEITPNQPTLQTKRCLHPKTNQRGPNPQKTNLQKSNIPHEPRKKQPKQPQ